MKELRWFVAAGLAVAGVLFISWAAATVMCTIMECF